MSKRQMFGSQMSMISLTLAKYSVRDVCPSYVEITDSLFMLLLLVARLANVVTWETLRKLMFAQRLGAPNAIVRHLLHTPVIPRMAGKYFSDLGKLSLPMYLWDQNDSVANSNILIRTTSGILRIKLNVSCGWRLPKTRNVRFWLYLTSTKNHTS